MEKPFLETFWGPVLLAAVAADVNFLVYASIGTNEGDAVGVAFFLFFAAYAFFNARARRSSAMIVAAIGAIAAAMWMGLREIDRLDFGYIPPYILFIVMALGGQAIAVLAGRRRETRRTTPSRGEGSDRGESP